MRPLASLRARERAIRTPALPITDPDPREALAAAIWARAMPADAEPGWYRRLGVRGTIGKG